MKLLAAYVVAVLCMSLPAVAQVDMGAVRGTVTDPGGALIAGAKVTLTNEGKGLAITKLTGKDGTYTFSPVQIGSYQITVQYHGFRPATSHFIVTVQEQARADFRMLPGGETDTVTVTGLAPQLQTQDASVGSVTTSRQITNLPLNSLNYTFLAQLDAGVTSLSPTRGLNNTGSFVANGLPSIHNNYLLDGIDNNNDTVDYLNGSAYVNLPPPDAIQEFKLQTSNFSAEFGRAGGAVINASLKSGTNEFHGSAWEFLRNDMLDASGLGNYFLAPANRVKGELRRNQFGVSAGGPILKNRTFFFGDYSGTRIVSDGTSRPTVPTNAQVSSGYTDFRDLFSYTSATTTDALGRKFNNETILDPATTRLVTKGTKDPVTGINDVTSTGYVRDPFVAPGGPSIANVNNFATAAWFPYLNQIPSQRLDKVAIKLLQLYPAANAPGFVNNYQITQKTPDNANHFDARVDQILGQRDQMFGRVSYTTRHEFVPATFPASSHTFSSGNGNFDDQSLNIAYSNTYTFSPHVVNETRFGYSHLYTSSQPPDANTMGIPEQYGIAGIPQVPGNGGLPAIGISGLTSLGIQTWASPNWRVSNTYQFTSNLIWSKGGHNFKTGIEYQHLRFPWVDPTTSHGSFSFGGYTGIPGLTSGVGMADLLLTPVPSTVQGGVDNVGGANAVAASAIAIPNDYRNIFGTYIQDDWKATRKLTLNLGLRWEYFGSLQEQDGRQAALESDDNGANARYVILDRQKNLPLSAAFLALLAKDGIPLDYVSQIHNTPLTNFAPRVGLAYLVTPKLVARGSYGIFYSGFENLGGSPDPGADYPFSSNFSFTRPDAWQPLLLNGSIATIENGLSAVNLEPSSPQFTPTNLSPTAFTSKWTTAYVQEWNAALEYQLTPSQTLTLTYVGSNTHHMWNSALMNEPNVILPTNTTNTTTYDPYPDLARNMIYQVPNGSAIYESMQIKFERRFSHGLNLLANYTQEVCKSDNHSPLNIPDEADRMQAYNLPGWGIHKGYQYCGSDAPRIFHASGIWELPVGKGRLIAGGTSGVVNGVIGGWSAQGIFAAQDGFPFSVGCATSTTAIYGCYADLVPNQPIYSHKGPHGITQFLNPAAFTNPPAATSIGQSDYSPLGGPATQAHGPGYTNLDLSVFKRFAVRENTHLEFRGEFYNALNHPNFSNSFSTLNFTNPQFGKISGTRGNERQVQLAMKYYW